MRKFSIDAPAFYCFQIGDSEEVYKVPLMASLRIPEAHAWQEASEQGFLAQVEWLRGYTGDAIDALSVEQIDMILHEWVDATKEQGATAGESSASSK